MNLYEGSALPLEGVRVLDFSTAVAAPACGRLLADMGADVIKIDTPSIDLCRTLGPVYNVPTTPVSNPFHVTANSNKRFITLNMRSDEGKAVFFQLLEEADVLLTSMRTKALQAMGISYEDLKERFPRLVLAHLTGFGYNGDESERPGYDVAAFWSRNGTLLDWGMQGTPPLIPGFGTGDVYTGTALFSGIMAALYAREKTGKGTLVTTSLLGAGIWANGNYIFMTQPPYNYQTPPDPTRTNSPFFNSFKCKDDVWISVVMPGPLVPVWEKACKAFGLDEYINDPRFGTNENLLKHNSQNELHLLICDVISKKAFDEWHEILLAAEVVHERIMRSSELTSDKQALANGYLEKVTLQDGDEVFYPTIPVQFSEYKLKPINVNVDEGQNTKEILIELGYTSQQIESMYESKTVL